MRGVKDQLLGHLVKGMVVIFKANPSDTEAVRVGIVNIISDTASPRPVFQVDVMFGTVDNPSFHHNYGVSQYSSTIDKVCVQYIFTMLLTKH